MTRTLRLSLLVGLFLATLSLTGCGSKTLKPKETFPAQGRIVLGGEPVRFAIVRLTPKSDSGQPADGNTDEHGVFHLRTYSNGDPDGAVPGEYRVTIEGYDAARVGALPEGATPSTIPAGVPKQEVTIEIKSGDNDLGDIKID
jgi:hypothetical protein